MLTRHLGSEKAYREVRDELHDMGEYLDSDLLRRQSNTMVRLTVITIAGLIGMTTTGFFGMNLLTWADAPLRPRYLLFRSVGPDSRTDRCYTVVQVTAPGRIVDALSDERVDSPGKSGRRSAKFGIQPRDSLSACDVPTGRKRTCLVAPHMSAFGGKADVTFCGAHIRF